MANILVPRMHSSAIPKPQSRLDFAFALSCGAVQKVLEQEGDLLAESVETFPPCAALVLVSVAREDVVEQGVDVVQLGYIMGRCLHQGCCCDDGGRSSGR